SNTVANPRGELKAITTRSGLVLDGPSGPMPPPFINPEEDERNYVVHQRDPLHPNIHYPSRMHQEKQQEKDEVQIHKFWKMFKQLHINISLTDALILIPKYQKMLKNLLSNKEKLLELANTPLNENCSTVILKKLPEKLGDPGKFLIPCGFSELKCKALADIGASINLMPLSATNHPSGNPTSSLTSHTDLTSPEVINKLSGNPTPISEPVTKSNSSSPTLTSIEESDLICKEFKAYLTSDSFPLENSNPSCPLPPFYNSLSGSTTSSSPDLPFDIESDLREIEYLLNHDPTKEMDSILEDSVDEGNLADPNNDLIYTIPEMFTDDHTWIIHLPII
ncbi:hypothetical protein Tco_0052455, partial [Tanacetum coccineum]